jgi:hypothetical protein
VARGQDGSTAAAHLDGVTVVVAGVLTAASLKNNPLALTTTGDLPYLNSSGNQARLGIGSAGAVLTVTAGIPAWTLTPAITSITLSGLTAGRVPIVSTAGLIADDAAFTYDTATDTLSLTTLHKFVPTSQQLVVQLMDQTRAGYFKFRNSLSAGPTTDYSGTILTAVSKTSAGSLQGDDYFNPIYRWSVTDGTNSPSGSYELGSEGNWTNAGGFTQQRLYLWQFDTAGENGRSIFYIDLTEPNQFKFGTADVSQPISVIDLRLLNGIIRGDGLATTAASPPADGTVLSAQFTPTINKSTATAVTYPLVSIKPVLNFTGSNANSTVNVFAVDTTNTSLTGSPTVNLWSFSYGGTQRCVLTSAGNLGLGPGTTPANVLTALPATDGHASLTDLNGTAAASTFYFGESITDITQNVRMARVEALWNPASNPASNRSIFAGHFTARVSSANSQTITNGTLQCVSATSVHSGTGSINNIYGFIGLAQNSSTGTVTSARSGALQVLNTNAGGTIATAYCLQILDLSNAGTITTTYGIHIGDLSAGTQTTVWSLYASDANAPSFLNATLKIGGTAVRGTTEGTNQLALFDGTAPVGTLANGVSLYGASGYLKLIDAAGLDGHVLAGSAINTVTPALQNRTITVSVGGTTLYITAKTTND